MRRADRIDRVLVVAFALGLWACAASTSQYHAATVGAVTLHDALAAVQDTADVLHDAAQITDAQHQAINAKLVPLLMLGDEIAVTIRQWPVGTAAPAQLRNLISQMGTLTQALIDVLPEGVAQSALLKKALAVQVLVTQLLLS